MKTRAFFVLALSLVSFNAFAAADPCTAVVRAAAAAKTRESADFKHWGKGTQIRSIEVQVDDEGMYDVTVTYALPQEDEGETGSAFYNIGVEQDSDNSCRVVEIN
jgi:hypothetical protein